MHSIKVFVASPGDVEAERDALGELIIEMNEMISSVAPEKALTLELLRWETHAAPAAGRPQEVVTEAIGDYDVFVGIMWRRFGSPTGVAQSGTKEEFDLAYSRWEKERRPHIMFYFCQAHAPPPRTREEVQQLSDVVSFRDEVARRALVWEYRDHAEFRSVVRPHLLAAIKRLIGDGKAEGAPTPTALPRVLESRVRTTLLDLAVEYQSLRDNMDPGEARTRQMELVTTRIRTMAVQAESMLGQFAGGITPGERLVAAAFLQVIPRHDYLSWLAERLDEKQPFLGYHAAVALLAAARTLDCSFRDDIRDAIQNGLERLTSRGISEHTDRARTLQAARAEIEQRCLTASR